jgi:hypothetical protein
VNAVQNIVNIAPGGGTGIPMSLALSLGDEFEETAGVALDAVGLGAPAALHPARSAMAAIAIHVANLISTLPIGSLRLSQRAGLQAHDFSTPGHDQIK